MDEKDRKIAMLREVFSALDAFLTRLSEAQILAKPAPSGYSVQETIAHLLAWQQVTNARLEAAALHRDPAYPGWLGGLSPEEEEHIDAINARIYQAYRDLTWAEIHAAWKAGFARVIEQAEALPAQELLEPGKYPWLGEHPLAAVLEGTCGHHAEHLEEFLALYP